MSNEDVRIETYGEFDSLTHEMDYGVTMPEGFSVYVMRHRENGSYLVRAWLDHPKWVAWSEDQSAMQDYMKLCGHETLFMGTDFQSEFREFWLMSTPDEDTAWDVAVAAEDLLKVTPVYE